MDQAEDNSNITDINLRVLHLKTKFKVRTILLSASTTGNIWYQKTYICKYEKKSTQM